MLQYLQSVNLHGPIMVRLIMLITIMSFASSNVLNQKYIYFFFLNGQTSISSSRSHRTKQIISINIYLGKNRYFKFIKINLAQLPLLYKACEHSLSFRCFSKETKLPGLRIQTLRAGFVCVCLCMSVTAFCQVSASYTAQ